MRKMTAGKYKVSAFYVFKLFFKLRNCSDLEHPRVKFYSQSLTNDDHKLSIKLTAHAEQRHPHEFNIRKKELKRI